MAFRYNYCSQNGKTMDLKQTILTILISFGSALGAVFIYEQYLESEPGPQPLVMVEQESVPSAYTKALSYAEANPPIDFTSAAGTTTPAVVHIKTVVKQESTRPVYRDPFFEFFGDAFGGKPYPKERRGSGSGVIISPDGFIVTNNHVIQNADEINVTLNNKETFQAQLIGTDLDTDIALLKINRDKLPYIPFADSDSVSIGEWVLAVGNPFNLASTVTAGIVSAKGRNINILNNLSETGGNTAIESFIQTDAAVNPGNSGGALVNTQGELIGINTAIATPTGTFTGYSFAVPANLVKKVVVDLREFGAVQRGFLGVSIVSVNSQLAEQLELDEVKGVYIDGVRAGSAAEEAGLQKNDIIVFVEENPVNTAPELQEQVAKYRPGDQIIVDFLRDGELYRANVTLKDKNNEVAFKSDKDVIEDDLGVVLEDLSKAEAMALNLPGGIVIKEIKPGKIAEYTNVEEGFIIISADGQQVGSIEDLVAVLKNKSGSILFEGVYPNRNMVYPFALKM